MRLPLGHTEGALGVLQKEAWPGGSSCFDRLGIKDTFKPLHPLELRGSGPQFRELCRVELPRKPAPKNDFMRGKQKCAFSSLSLISQGRANL